MELTFKLLKNEKEQIVGFSLEAGGETYSEMFCVSIGKAIRDKGTAVIKLEAEAITFLNPPKSYSAKIKKEEAEALKVLLGNPKKLGLYSEPYCLGEGFRVVLTEEKDKKLVSV